MARPKIEACHLHESSQGHAIMKGPAASFARALSHRNYRLYLAGQSISLVGIWMQQLAMSWLVYRQSGSAFLLGVIAFSGQIPSLFISPAAGVLADRWNRHRALLITQSLAMCQAVLLVVIVQEGSRQIGPLISISLFLGIINAFDMPLRQSFVVEMVTDREHLGNAIALNSSIVNGARLVGPALAGMVIATWGEATCFLLNAVSYLAVLGALLAMRDLPPHRPAPHRRFREELWAGLAHAFGFPPLRALLLQLAILSLMSMPLNTLMPVFAKVILHGNARTQGFLTGALGAGALLAALSLATRRSVLGLGRLLVLTGVFFGAGQVVFSFSHSLGLDLAVLAVTGFCMMFEMAASNTLIQTIVDEDKRGRVMSLYSMAFLGVGPVGSLLGGLLADRIGAPVTVRIAGAACTLTALVFAAQLPRLREHVRPIYRKAGILPGIDA